MHIQYIGSYQWPWVWLTHRCNACRLRIETCSVLFQALASTYVWKIDVVSSVEQIIRHSFTCLYFCVYILRFLGCLPVEKILKYCNVSICQAYIFCEKLRFNSCGHKTWYCIATSCFYKKINIYILDIQISIICKICMISSIKRPLVMRDIVDLKVMD